MHGMWCSQVLVGLQGRQSAVLRLSSGVYQACTSLPSCASCRPRTAGCQSHLTQAWIPSRYAAMYLQCGYCSAGTPWTPMSVATSLQEHPLAWAPHQAPAVVHDPEEGFETPGPEDVPSKLFSTHECLGWLCLLRKASCNCSTSPTRLEFTEMGLPVLLPLLSGV